MFRVQGLGFKILGFTATLGFAVQGLGALSLSLGFGGSSTPIISESPNELLVALGFRCSACLVLEAFGVWAVGLGFRFAFKLVMICRLRLQRFGFQAFGKSLYYGIHAPGK